MTPRLAIYVDRTGKQPAAPVSLRLDSADAVKTAKFFAALGFTVEKQASPEGRLHLLAKATNVELSIFPARTPSPVEDFSMTLIVDDAAAAVLRAEAAGGTILTSMKDVPGGKKCAVASFEGQRVIVAQLTVEPQPIVAAESSAAPAAEAEAEDDLIAAAVEESVPEEEESLLDQLVAAERTANFEASALDDPLNAQAEPEYDPLAEPPPPERVPEPIGPSEEELRWERWKSYSRADLGILANVRKATIWTAIAYVAFLLSVMPVYSALSTFSPQRRGVSPDLTPLYIAVGIGIAGCAASIIGKCLVAGQQVRRASPDLVVAAICADGAGVVLSLLTVAPAVRGVASIGSEVCLMISGVVFARYLWLVAEAVEDRVGRIGAMVVVGLYGVVVLFLIITLWGFAVATDKDKELLGLGLIGVLGTTMLVRSAYAAYCVVMAIRLTPPQPPRPASSTAPQPVALSAEEMAAMPLHALLAPNGAGRAAAPPKPKPNSSAGRR